VDQLFAVVKVSSSLRNHQLLPAIIIGFGKKILDNGKTAKTLKILKLNVVGVFQ
jgi:hypothetical protein